MYYKNVTPEEYPILYDVLRKAGMPDLPTDLSVFSTLAKYIYFQGMYTGEGKMIGAAALYFQPSALGGIGFDVGVLPQYKGKWATRGLFTELFDIGFNQLNAEYLISTTEYEDAAKALLTLGFEFIGTREGKQVYVLNDIPEKYRDTLHG